MAVYTGFVYYARRSVDEIQFSLIIVPDPRAKQDTVYGSFLLCTWIIGSGKITTIILLDWFDSLS